MKIARLLILALLPLVVVPAWADESTQREETYKNLEIFSNVLMMMQQHYVDVIDPQEVITGAINGMLTSLDPHSSYLPPEDFKELQEETHGSFSGIGIEITIKDGILTVVSPIEDTPAYRADLKAGDQIIRINDELTKNMTLMDAVKLLRGKKGTSVKISIFRSSWQELKDFTLVRDEIPVHSVKSMVLRPEAFYVRISNFQANTTRDLLKAMDEQSAKEPIQGLVLDLRNNPGGLLDQAVKVADVFLDTGVIVSTRGRNPDQDLNFEATPNEEDSRYDFPIIVLVNSGSASASEIVAGALQDHGRAMVIGTETFGKGSVQTIIPMSNGAGLRLTTAKYYTPSGDSIQAKGIKPDIIVPFIVPEKDRDMRNNGPTLLREKDLPNHFENDEGDEGEDKGDPGQNLSEAEKRLQRDNQLRTALYILKGMEMVSRNRKVMDKVRQEGMEPGE